MAYEDPPLTPPQGEGQGVGFCFGHQSGICSSGYFITEQVGRRQDDNLLAAFGWNAESFGPTWWWSISDVIQRFEAFGCRVVAHGEYDTRYWFQNIESLVFYLKARPIPDDFDAARHWQAVKTIVEQHTTPRGVESNEHVELLIVQKL